MRQPFFEDIDCRITSNASFPKYIINLLRIYAAIDISKRFKSNKESKKQIDTSIKLGIKYLPPKYESKAMVHHILCEEANYNFLLSSFASITTTPIKFKGDTVIPHDKTAYIFGKQFNKTKFLAAWKTLGWQAFDPKILSKVPSISNTFLPVKSRELVKDLELGHIIQITVGLILFYGNTEIIRDAANSFDSDSIVLWCAMEMFPNDKDLHFLLPSVSNRLNYDNDLLDFSKDPVEFLYLHLLLHLVINNKFKEIYNIKHN